MMDMVSDELIERIRARLAEMDGPDRVLALRRLSEGYCPHCGTDHLPCYCDNDE